MTDLERLQGYWQAIAVTDDGQVRPAEEVRRTRLAIHDDNYSLHVGDRVFHGFIAALDAEKEPRSIDFVHIRLPVGESRRYLGIYHLGGEELTFCTASAGKERPASFAAQPGSGRALHRFRRQRFPLEP
jgi:uncharacterized protein (TIGR03067 family)